MGMKLARFVFAALLPLTLVTIVQPSTASAVTYGDPVENPQIEYPEVVPVWVGGNAAKMSINQPCAVRPVRSFG